MTCAHVVADALGLPREQVEPPREPVEFDFPARAPGEWRTAEVEVDGWRPMRRVASFAAHDVAVLRFRGEPPAGTPVVPITLEATYNHGFTTYGVPKHFDNGTFADGRFKGQILGGRIEVQASNPVVPFVAAGFSGGAAWDDVLGAVAGMVTEADDATGKAVVIPMSQLVEVWPALGQAASAPTRVADADDDSAAEALERAIACIDREPWADRLALSVVDVARGESRRPIVYVVSGPPEEAPHVLVRRFDWFTLRDELRDVLEGQGLHPEAVIFAEMAYLRWPDSGRLDGLLDSLRARIDACAGVSPEAVRSALDRPGPARAFYCDPVLASRFDATQLRLLDGWLEFWSQVGRGGLRQSTVVVVSVAMDGAPPTTRGGWLGRLLGRGEEAPDLASYIAGLDARRATLDGIHLVLPERLGPIRLDDVRRWRADWSSRRPQLRDRLRTIQTLAERELRNGPDFPMQRFLDLVDTMEPDR